jgi:hypothetical protein
MKHFYVSDASDIFVHPRASENEFFNPEDPPVEKWAVFAVEDDRRLSIWFRSHRTAWQLAQQWEKNWESDKERKDHA